MKQLLYIAALICSFSSALGQNPVLSVDFTCVEAGDPVVVTVKSPVPGKLEIEFPDEFVSGSSVQSGMKQEMNYNTSKINTVYFYVQNGAFSKEGNYSIRAVITDKNRSYKSNTVRIRVQKQPCANQPISKRNLRQPIFGVVERSKSRVYEGEPVIVNGKVYTKLKVAVQGYHPFEVIGNPEAVTLSGSNDLIFSPEMLKGHKYASAQFGKQLLFFTTPGKYQINPFEMAVLYEIEENYAETSVFTSNGNSIEVIPLPEGAPNDFIGAVGKFHLSRSFDKTSAGQGDVVTMTVVISGHGNLHNINTPEVRLPKGVVVYGDPVVDQDVTFGLRGAEGKITYTYNLQVLQPGDFDLGPMSVSYFDPELKRYITLREGAASIRGDASGTFHAQLPKEIEKKNPETSGLEPVIASEGTKPGDHFIHSMLFWPAVFSPLALAFLGGLIFTRRKKITEKVSERSKARERHQEIARLLKTAEAKAAAGDTREGFALIQQSLKMQAAVLLKQEHSNLTKAEILHGLQEMHTDPEMTDQFNRLLLRCEEARYAFMDQPELFHQTLKETGQLIQNLPQQ